MNEFNGRLTDSGQGVTDQIIPFSKIRGGWIQDSKAAWDRLIVPSGDDQVVRIGRVRSSVVTAKESLLRLAKQCLSMEEQPFDELTMDAMSLVSKFENHMISRRWKKNNTMGASGSWITSSKRNRSPNQGAGIVLIISKKLQLYLPFAWSAGQRSKVMASNLTESLRKRTKTRPRKGKSMKKSAGTKRPSSRTWSMRHKKVLHKILILGLIPVRLTMTKATKK